MHWWLRHFGPVSWGWTFTQRKQAKLSDRTQSALKVYTTQAGTERRSTVYIKALISLTEQKRIWSLLARVGTFDQYLKKKGKKKPVTNAYKQGAQIFWKFSTSSCSPQYYRLQTVVAYNFPGVHKYFRCALNAGELHALHTKGCRMWRRLMNSSCLSLILSPTK